MQHAIFRLLIDSETGLPFHLPGTRIFRYPDGTLTYACPDGHEGYVPFRRVKGLAGYAEPRAWDGWGKERHVFANRLRRVRVNGRNAPCRKGDATGESGAVFPLAKRVVMAGKNGTAIFTRYYNTWLVILPCVGYRW